MSILITLLNKSKPFSLLSLIKLINKDVTMTRSFDDKIFVRLWVMNALDSGRRC